MGLSTYFVRARRAVLVILAVVALPSFAHADSLIFRNGNMLEWTLRGNVLEIDEQSLSFRAVYSAQSVIQPTYVNPSSTALLFGEYDSGRLIMFDLQDKRPKTISDGLYSYSRWSPDGSKIAFITRKPQRAGEPEGEAQLSGVWIYDVKRDKSEKIRANGRAVGWAPFDKRLYIKLDFEGPVVSYDPETKTFQDSAFRDVNFSPDGNYYYYLGYEMEAIELYATSTNARVWEERLKRWYGVDYQYWYGRHFLEIFLISHHCCPN